MSYTNLQTFIEENVSGHYIANGQKYLTKIDAILSFPKAKTLSGRDVVRNLQWVFFDDKFNEFNWFKEPKESLDQLYKNRAQQLRDTYDHIVVCYSGGVDSQQVLDSFVKNNILIDEICFFGSFQNDEKLQDNNSSKYVKSKNFGLQNLEIQNVAIPYVKEIQKKWPNLIVDYYDHTEDFRQIYLDDKNYDWISTGSNRFSPNRACKGLIHRIRRPGQGINLLGKKIAYIWGFDKPRLICIEDKWYFYFVDSALGRNPGRSTNTYDEYFYWSPDAREILAKQAHEIKRFIELDYLRATWFKSQTIKKFPIEFYHELIKPIIYPSVYKPDLFVVPKAANMTFSETYDWFYNDDDNSFKAYKDGIKSLANTVDHHFFNIGHDGINFKGDPSAGLKGSISPLYQFAESNVINYSDKKTLDIKC